ncbi:SDR family NAD(P)-dependent oxidoreductase [Acanthopleuribacter pedis]|uniref:SDR family NAD(P)-dependent oxidoreductase n=1 Tax=Acanthopleuribacter pedis TaxID=442870 RepID=A0A8J7Q2G1_9BACT|nr:SDR family NAD(P)-dependent oxidoreductase [Acanthopleuribacter pedis]MBO1319312.1 SDR family NAD(P)-dependent oxidoreductase [Acanthopleuribacter pedis]
MKREAIDRLVQNPLWDELESWMSRLLGAQLRCMGAFKGDQAPAEAWRALGVQEKYAPWWCTCALEILQRNGQLPPPAADEPAAVWAAWEPRLQAFLQEPEMGAAVQLVDACLRRLPDILRGTLAATDVLFPRAAMSRVENIYRRNTLADYLNGLVADAAVDHLQQRLATDPNARLRLIEIGAGTGGTSAVVLPALRPFQDHIDGYVYTDISQAFLIHAKTHFLPEFPFVQPMLWNVEQPLPAHIEAGSFDLAIATNVLHATRNIRESLRHVKTALKSGGRLILNEGVQKTTLNSLTFGLLDGWWRFEDPKLRIPGSPLLETRTWRRVLAWEGYRYRPLPPETTAGLGQQIVVGESDGMVRHTKALPTVEAEAHTQPAPAVTAAKPTEATAPTPAAVPTVDVRTHVGEAVSRALTDSLKLDEAVQCDIPFSDYGIDSILGVGFVDHINASLGLSLHTAILFDYTTVERLADYLSETYADRIRRPETAAQQANPAPTMPAQTAPAPPVAPTPIPSVQPIVASAPQAGPAAQPDVIAVIGLSGQFPSAPDPETFWRNLIEGRDGIQPLPEAYRDLDRLVGRDAEGNLYYQWGGVLEHRNHFDPLFFNIAPREAESMNPHQRLILQESWKALEDAGRNPRALDGSQVGIFVGAEPTEYFYESFTGASEAIVASRLSYHLNLRGPALVVNTGCSSSAVAIHLACESLRSGESALALAGGVSAVMKQSGLNTLAEAGMLSPTGACHTFDATGNGTVLSEGVGMVVLKRHAEAVADGDPIYGVILGSGMNQDGTSNGITAPNGLAQESLIRDVQDRFHINADHISYMEAHGTGTNLGDPVEGNALVRAFRGKTARTHFCRVGSAKAHIGHTSAAAGVIGLIKILLSLKHRKLPGLLHFNQLNPQIDFADSPFFIDAQPAEWVADGAPLTAALNSFGHSGTNVHLVVAEPRQPAATPDPGQPQLVPLSAFDRDRLNEVAANLLAFLERAAAAPRLCDLAYTLQVGREAMAERIIFQVRELAELKTHLKSFVATGKVTGRQGRVSGKGKHSQLLAGGDEDSRALIAAWTAKGKLDKLADLWVQGVVVDWDLIPNGDARRISLPGYPFAREHFDAPHKTSTADLKRAPGSALLHPLCQRNTSTLKVQRYSATFSGDEFFFADHRVHGARVLPGVAYLELARTAVVDALGEDLGDARITLKDVVWTRPIRIDDAALDVHIQLEPSQDRHGNEEIRFQIQTDVVHAEGLAVQEPAQTIVHDLDALRAAVNRETMDAETLYDAFHQMGIDYGPGHRGLSELRFDTFGRGDTTEPQIVARLDLPAGFEDHPYTLHPGLMDAALQASIGFMLDSGRGENAMKPSLPFALEALEVFAPIPDQSWVWTRPSENASFYDRVQKLDIDVCDGDGKVCVRMKRFSSRTLEGAIPAAGATQDDRVGLITMSPVWNLTRPEPAPLDTDQRMLVIGGETALTQAIRDLYPKARLLSLAGGESVEALTSELRTFGDLDHLVWTAPAPQADDLAAERLIADQNGGVIQVFRLVKALLAAGYGERDLHWTLITRQTLAVTANEAVDPTHAAVHGLVGSLAKEYPHWQVRLVDVAAAQSPSAQRIFQLPAHPEGDAQVLRAESCYTRGLAPVTAAWTSDTPGYRKGGVYVVIGGAGGIGEVWTQQVVNDHDAHVYWLGRRSEDARIRERLAACRNTEYIQADAGDRAALEQAAARIKQKHPRIHGVVHSAIVLLDKSLARMDETRFRAGLSAKVDVSVRLAQVFGDEQLDFVLFFSSLQSFTRGAGQANYAAGCTFKDAYALALADAWPGENSPRIRVMNWGYWGTVGIVTDAAYQKRMAEGGLGSIEPAEGMAAVDHLLRGEAEQLILLKTLVPDVVNAMCVPERVQLYPPSIPDCFAAFPKRLPQRNDDIQAIHAAMGPDLEAMNRLYLELLGATLASLDLFGANPPALPKLYERWFAESINLLQQHGHLCGEAGAWRVSERLNLTERWAEWERGRPSWMQAENQKAQIILVEACLRALPDILRGRRQATDVLFPNASMELVEGIHKGNVAADLFNEVLEETVVAYLEERCLDPNAEIRILEIGAGTGGTTAGLLPRLKPFHSHIHEYCFTDISRAFLLHAETNYAAENPFLTTAMFDVGLPLAGQNIAPDRYDLVIATNVLHATADIRQTLRNAKAALHRNGLLILNELCSNSLFAHLTFGLLEGWWLYEDSELRIPGCPGLYPETWGALLESEGFAPVLFPAEAVRELGQQVMVAPSDGFVRQDRAEAEVPVAAAVTGATEADADALEHTGDSLRERAAAYIKRIVAATLRMSSRQLDTAQPLEMYGLDSILVVHLTNAMRQHFDGITSTLFFEVQTIDALVDHLLETQEETLAKQVGPKAKAKPAKAAAPNKQPAPSQPLAKSTTQARRRFAAKPAEPERPAVTARPAETKPAAHAGQVAMIGLSGRYPMAADVAEFWQRLIQGANCISEVPADRWDWKRYHSDKPGVHGKIYSRWGGFIDHHDRFDPLFFQISPREARLMDPQERIFLETAHACIEDAGYTPATLADDRRRVGVYAGVMNSTYAPQPNFATISNRISYVFDFHGPSMTLDTACSSSLTAIHLAVESINAGTCDAAIAGGVHLNLHPIHYQGLCEVRMLSPDGRCKTFGEGADGFVPGEGTGAVLLKPLAQALADKDPIYGIIRGSMINAGGKTNGYTVPNPNAQYRLIADAVARGEVDPRTISYVEAHGTGTSLGDPIEISALTRAFKESPNYRAGEKTCAVGSVKANVGHCESAAGIAGLTKILLQMKHGKLAPSLHADPPNPHIDFDSTPFSVPHEATEWRPKVTVNGKPQPVPRRAGLSSFGAGGANAHLILEEAPALAADHELDRDHLIMLSARKPAQLEQMVANLHRFLAEAAAADEAVSMTNLAYTLQVGREAMEERLALIARTAPELENKLKTLLDQWAAGEPEEVEDLFRGTVASGAQGPAVNALSVFAADEELQEAVDKWIERGKFARLLDVWVQGLAFDWRRLYRDDQPRPRRIHLPTYPFARDRYWMEGDAWVPAIEEEGSSMGPRGVNLGVWQNKTAAPSAPAAAQTETTVAAPQPVPEPVRTKPGPIAAPRYTAPAAKPDGLVRLTPLEEILPIGTPTAAPAQTAPTSGPSRETLHQALMQGLAEALFMQVADINPDKAFTDMGLDSIIGVEWIQAVNQSYGLDLQATQLYETPNIREFTAFLHQTLTGRAMPATTGSTTKPDVLPKPSISLPAMEPVASAAPKAAVATNSVAEGAVAPQPAPTPAAPVVEAAPPVAPRLRSLETLRAEVRATLADALFMQPDEVDLDRPFIAMGLDSIIGVEWIQTLNERYGLDLQATKIYDHPTVREFATFLQKEAPLPAAPPTPLKPSGSPVKVQPPVAAAAQPEPPVTVPAPAEATVAAETTPQPKPREPEQPVRAVASATGAANREAGPQEPIAIIGMSGRYPGAADLDQYWQNLTEGVDSVVEIPRSRWNAADYYDANPGAPGKINCKWLGLLDDVACFDPLFFMISPAEAEGIDPQHRLFLEEAWRAFEDAGLNRDTLSNTRCGVYLGIMSNEYAYLVSKNPDEVSVSGNSFAIAAARIAYYLNLKGPAIPIDTACSSSLVAAHLACQALNNREIDTALVGGVSLYLGPEPYLGLCASGMLSADGRCKTFDNRADGFVPGEGVGAVVLKRLADAEADGDRIEAVIIGSGINQDGKTNGITAPSSTSQAALEREVYRRNGIAADSIGYVETHGTGTKLGDPIEIEALTTVFREHGATGPCAVGSVKSNLGHTSAAAGVASLHKVVHCLQQRTLVPSLHFREANSHLNLARSPFYVNTETKSWEQGKNPRRAAVSSFGFSGTNAHLVVEEYRQPARVTAPEGETLIPLSAKDGERLLECAQRLLHYLRAEGDGAAAPQPPQADAGELTARVVALLADILNLNAADIDSEQDFIEYGVEPLHQARLREMLEQTLGLELDGRVFMQQDSVRAIVAALLPAAVTRSKAQPATASGALPPRRPQSLPLTDLAHTLQFGRDAMEERVAFVAGSTEELALQLEAFIARGGTTDARQRTWRGSVRDYGALSAGLDSPDDLQDMIELRLARRDLARLAGYWARGAGFDWNRLTTGPRSRPLSLPTYPFARERYWAGAEETAAPVPATPAAQPSRAGVLHPLLHEQTTNQGEPWFTTHFTGREWLLTDHVLRFEGAPEARVLPGAAHLEMARAAAEQTLGHDAFHLANILWLRPLIVNEPHDVKTRLFPRDTGPDLGFEIFAEQNGEPVVYSQGRVVLGRGDAGVGAVPQRPMAAGLTTTAGSACYQLFATLGVHYGPACRALTRLTGDARGVWADLALPAVVAGDAAAYTLHPSLLDAALQAAVGLYLGESGEPDARAGLPFALDEVRIWSKTKPTQAYVRLASQQGGLNRLDVDLLDADGKPCVCLKGYASKPSAPKPPPKKADAEALICRRAWQTRPATEGHPQPFAAHLVLLAAPLQLEPDPAYRFVALISANEDPATAYRAAADQVFASLRAFLSEQKTGRLLVQLIHPATEAGQQLGGLGAMLKTARLEQPRLCVQIIEVPADTTNLAQKVHACSRVPEETDIRYGDGSRALGFWEEIPAEPAPAPWREGGVYLITGGLGGLGLLFANHIATQTQTSTLVLIGRSPADPSKLARLEQQGARVIYRQVDVSQKDAVVALVGEIERDQGRLDGVLHSAGLTRDQFLIHKTAAEFDAVFAPKVQGTVNLDTATRHLNPELFVLFSSSAGAAGSIGQADYAAANGFMDRYAASRNARLHREQRVGRTLSVNWPLWEAGGMRPDPQTEQRLWRETGMAAMASATGIRALERALMTDETQVMVLAGDNQRLRRVLGPAAEPTASAPSSEAVSRVAARDWLRDTLAAGLKIPATRLLSDEPFEHFGIDSIQAVKLTTLLENEVGSLPKTLFFECGNLNEITDYLLEHHAGEVARVLHPPAQAPQPTAPKADRLRFEQTVPTAHPNPRESDAAIAVVGLAGRYPLARDLDAFWANLRDGRDCIVEVPKDRWDWREYYSENREVPGAHYSRYGGFIEDAATFDSLFFNISPKEARFLDPQERLFLEQTWSALEDAGYNRKTLRGAQVGVYAGVMYSEYQFFGVEASMRGARMGFAGTLAGIANRVSYLFDLHGPSMTVETMCSSSLTAIHLACQDLRLGVTDMAVAGGVNLSVHPNKYLMLSSGQFISSRGRCEAFGEGGDGYIPGEGVGVAILKRLADAERDRDHIYGVIRGSAINHGGRTNGYSVPNPRAQQRAVSAALNNAGVNPRHVSYIEAHGTGTRLGDPIEITGLTRAFREHTADTGFCRIGSVKSNIGHCEAAAGIAGLTKVLLQLKNGELVPSLHARVLNPNINFGETPFTVNQEICAWERPVIDGHTLPRLAGLSSFGAGGANAHLLVEEYQGAKVARQAGPYAYVLSAKNTDRLQASAANLLRFLEEHPDQEAADVAFTLQVGREALTERLAFTAAGLDEVAAKLRAFLSGQVEGLVRGAYRRDREAPAWEDLDAQQRAAIEAGRFEDLLARWCRGMDVDWAALWREQPYRISLPTYPFAGRRLWVDQPNQTTASEPSATPQKEADAFEPFHDALLDRLINEEIDLETALANVRGE